MPKMSRDAFSNYMTNANKKRTRSGYYRPVAPAKITDANGNEIVNVYQLRIMPPKKGSDVLASFEEHYYKSPITGEWIRALCPKQYNEKCLLSDQNRLMWNKAKNEDNKPLMNQLKKYFEKQGWLMCVYVKSDPVNPSNNGTIQIMNIGTKIRAKIQDGFANQDIGEAGCDTSPQGFDFLLKVRKQRSGDAGAEASVNYDLSEFARKPSPIQAVNDKRTEDEIWKEVPEDLTVHFPRKYTTEEWRDIVEKTINSGAPVETTKQAQDLPNPFDSKTPETEKKEEAKVEQKIETKAQVTNVEGDDLSKELEALKTDMKEGDDIPF